MNEAAGQPVPFLYSQSIRQVPAGLEHIHLTDLRKRAPQWLDPAARKLPRDALVAALRKALEDDEAAGRALRSLSVQERAVVAVYRRYGGSVDGEVIRVDLMSRGLLEIIEKKVSELYTQRQWKNNPIPALVNRWVLLSERVAGYGYDPYYGYGGGPDQPFQRYSLHAGIARRVEPAGPARWSIPVARGIPEAITRRSSAEVVLDLSRVFAYVAGRGSVKTRKDGSLAVPTVRAMEKSIPLDDGSEFVLPDPHGFYCELLRYLGVFQLGYNEIVVDPAAATRQFAAPGFRQMNAWAHAWVAIGNWWDGTGVPEGRDNEDSASRVRSGRQVLAWALGCLARAGDRWYELDTFIAGLHELQAGNHGFYLPYGKPAWDPNLSAARDKEKQTGAERQHAWWFAREGEWYANALMVTLVALGLIERARLGRDVSSPHAFRLTDSGRAVFGAPEVTPSTEPAERRCLVIQPNFDVVAYLDQADAHTAGILGRIAESGSARSGPVQTFRLTQASVYQAEESGLSHAQIVDFLRRHGQPEPPANVLRSLEDWSGKRESLSLRTGLAILAFPTEDERDAYLKGHPGAACGDRFVIASGTLEGPPKSKLSGYLTSDHLSRLRSTLELDEQGFLRTDQPVDLVQAARLRRIARPTATGWRLTTNSMRQAAAGGLKPGVVHRWLKDHLARPAPPLMAVAIDAWLRVGKDRPLELGDAVLLHVPDQSQFRAIVTSPRLRPFLLGSPGPQWLFVKRATRKELASALEELGFTLSRELTHDELPADRKIGGLGFPRPEDSV